jgi:hypothetical protein
MAHAVLRTNHQRGGRLRAATSANKEGIVQHREASRLPFKQPPPLPHNLRSSTAKATFRLIALAVFLAVAPTLASSSLAQFPFKKLQDRVNEEYLERKTGLVKKPVSELEPLKKLLKELEGSWNKERILHGNITGGYDQNTSESPDESETSAEDLHKIRIYAKLGRGAYPSRLTFEADASVQHRGITAQEEVATYYFSYERSAAGPKGSYFRFIPFAERFTDNFLSIDSRWSVGAEAMIGTEHGRVRRKVKEEKEDFARYCKDGEKWGGCWTRRLPEVIGWECPKDSAAPRTPESAKGSKSVNEMACDQKEELEQARKNAVLAIRRRDAVFAWGVGLGVLGELESGTIRARLVPTPPMLGPEDGPKCETETDSMDSADNPGAGTEAEITEKKEVVFPTLTSRRLRLLLHPYVLLRPTDKLTIQGDLWARSSLEKKTEKFLRVMKEDGTGVSPDERGIRAITPGEANAFDYFLDLRARLEYTLKKADTSDGSDVTVSLTYRWLKDRFPHAVTKDQYCEVVPDGFFPKRVTAADQHHIVALSIGIKWGS